MTTTCQKIKIAKDVKKRNTSYIYKFYVTYILSQ